jgi:hypothetical protein
VRPEYWFVYDLRTVMDTYLASFLDRADADSYAESKGLGDHALVTQRDIRNRKELGKAVPPRHKKR